MQQIAGRSWTANGQVLHMTACVLLYNICVRTQERQCAMKILGETRFANDASLM